MNVALITGASGGIGQALCDEFRKAGYRVIATDRMTPGDGASNVAIELATLARDPLYREKVLADLRELIGATGLDVLVNNAAHQVVRPLQDLDTDAFRTTLDVNVTAPYVLARGLLHDLVLSRGCIVNIGSIHASLTKPGFVAYSTSKAALHGLTRALAVELGGQVRVNAIAPAAIDTPMLRAGFADDRGAMGPLATYHPAGVIGDPTHVARLAVYLASERSPFVTGAVIGLDGAIGSRLHDPI